MGALNGSYYDTLGSDTFEDSYQATLVAGEATITCTNFTVTTMRVYGVLVYVQSAGADDWVAVYQTAATGGGLLGKAFCNGGPGLVNVKGDLADLGTNAFVVKSSVSSGKVNVNFRATKLT